MGATSLSNELQLNKQVLIQDQRPGTSGPAKGKPEAPMTGFQKMMSKQKHIVGKPKDIHKKYVTANANPSLTS